MDVTIKNRCPDIKLVSPVCFTKDVTCHMQFLQQVNAECIMKGNFIINIERDTFGGALLYRLRRKDDTLISAKLLIIWGYSSDGIYSHAYLIEHESTLIWNEEELERLWHVYDSQYNTHSNIGIWLLNDNTVLKTRSEASYRVFEMNTTIYEEKSPLYLVKPLWVDSNR
jgi:hypothetical protein